MSELRIMEWQGKYRIESGRQDGDKWWADRIRKKVWNKEIVITRREQSI